MNCHKRIFSLIVLITVIAWGGMAGAALAADNRGHGAPADALPKELKSVDVKDYFLPGKTKEAGVIQTAMGHVVVARGDLRQAYFAASGDKLYEQDIVFTLKASKCRIKLINNDVITLGDRTRITIKEVAGEINKAEKKTNLSMAQGKAMFYAIRVLSQKGAAMTVESPTSVAGVRGTKFGMEVDIEGENTTASLPLLLADASDDWGRHLILAQAGPGGPRGPVGLRGPVGPNITTTVHGFDGTVTVTSTVDGRTQSVGAGQTISATPQGIGALMPTPPQVSQRFQAATDVPPPAGSGSGSSSSGSSSSQSSGSSSGNAPDEKKSSDNTGTSNTNNPDTSNVTQQQNVNKEEKQSTTTTTTTTPAKQYKGHFTGMLEVLSSGYYYFNGTYMTNSVQDFSQAGATTNYSTYVNQIDGSSSPKNMTKLTTSDGTWTGSLPITFTKSGSNDYMEWGTWTQTSAMSTSGYPNYYNNSGAYVWGSPTTDSEMATLKSNAITGNYSGTAWGNVMTGSTSSTPLATTNLTGTFSGTVNFASQSVTNFNVNVSGTGGKSVVISNATGSFSGGTSTFTISPNSGTWQVNGQTASTTYSGATGTVYGNDDYKGQYIGGVWKTGNSSYKATGGFQGSK